MAAKYQQVEHELIHRIRTDQYSINEKLPTETNLIKEFNVSRQTIRRAISELERKHYVYKIQGSGTYVTDWHQNWNQKKSNKIIGVITTHVTNYIFPEIISGIDTTITDKGYSLILGNTHNNHQRERNAILNMLDLKVAGLIIEPTQSALPNPNIDLYMKIKELNIPIVFINSSYSNIEAPVLRMDDRLAEYELTNLLFEHGHQRIIGIFKVDDNQGYERMNGFIQAFQVNEIELSKSHVIMYQSSDHFSQICDNLNIYMKRTDPPTAICCYNDQLAIKIISYLQKHEVDVPADISVIGFDDYSMSRYINPRITTAIHVKRQMGIDAANQILSMLSGNTGKSITYHAHLITGQSIKRIKYNN